MSDPTGQFSFPGGSGYPAAVRIGPGLLFLCLAGCAATSAEAPAKNADITLTSAASDDEDSADAPTLDAARPARTNNPWIDCYRDFAPSDDPAADLARLGAACGARAGYTPVSSVHIGDAQGAGDPPERLLFRARAGRCYRVFAVAEPGARDLDVAIFNRHGRLIAGDASRDRWPVVPPRGPLCVRGNQTVAIEAAVTAGRGHALLQVWGSANDEDQED